MGNVFFFILIFWEIVKSIESNILKVQLYFVNTSIIRYCAVNNQEFKHTINWFCWDEDKILKILPICDFKSEILKIKDLYMSGTRRSWAWRQVWWKMTNLGEGCYSRSSSWLWFLHHNHRDHEQDNEGDWGVAVAAWRGMKKGQPGVPGILINLISINLIIIILIIIIVISSSSSSSFRHQRPEGEARAEGKPRLIFTRITRITKIDHIH